MIVRNVSDPETANNTHYEAGDRVRTMLIQAGVPTPELLPVPQKSYKQLLQEQIERERIADGNKDTSNLPFTQYHTFSLHHSVSPVLIRRARFIGRRVPADKSAFATINRALRFLWFIHIHRVL